MQGNSRKVFDARNTRSFPQSLFKNGLAPVLWTIILSLLFGFFVAIVFCESCSGVEWSEAERSGGMWSEKRWSEVKWSEVE